MKHSKNISFVFSLLLVGSLTIVGIDSYAAEKSVSKAAAVERTRQQVKMLDDLYKKVVVLITEHYVKDATESFPAATASKALFAEMMKKGWHDVRLLGLTDVLYNQEDKPNDAFEQAAAKKLLAGEAGHEEVVEKGGKRYLRVATGIPVVMEKCVMCHANFKGNKGYIGGLSYTVPVIE
jgi:hypothetical protein